MDLDLEVGGHMGSGDGSPLTGSRGRAHGGDFEGAKPHESSQYIKDIWLPNMQILCI